MKYLYAIILFVSMTFIAKAQDYHPFITGIDSVTFNRVHCFEACCPVRFTVRPVDTVYRDSTWRPVYGTWGGDNEDLVGWFQEDTLSQQIYLHQVQGTLDTIPLLLFDFMLQVDDSIIGYRPWNNGGLEDIGWVYVDSIGFLETLAGPRKILLLSKRSTEWSNIRLRWVEGIGLLENDVDPWSPPADFLNCRFDNEEQVFKFETIPVFPQFDTDCAPQCFGSVADLKKPALIRIYPNPATAQCTITLTDPSNSLIQCTVLNQLGQRVWQQAAEGQRMELRLSSLPRGYYTLIIDTRKGKVVQSLLK